MCRDSRKRVRALERLCGLAVGPESAFSALRVLRYPTEALRLAVQRGAVQPVQGGAL